VVVEPAVVGFGAVDFEVVDFVVVPQVSEWAELGLVEDHLGELVPAE
jgi:hypothetical protein